MKGSGSNFATRNLTARRIFVEPESQMNII
jgi:hypothetical protein